MLQLLYSQIVRTRRRYYEKRPELRRRLERPVISVGNLTVGGSGKTPLVAAIARMLLADGERPAILSRGYARTSSSDGVVVVSDGAVIRADVAHAGDEPYMLAKAVPGVTVVVNANRYLAGRVAESQLGCTVHLLDDGFQHLRLRRDIDLLVAPPDDFASTATLPFGRFREPLDAAKAADALLVPRDQGSAPSEIGQRLKVPTVFEFARLVDGPATDQPVFAFAGIAKPDQFFADLTRRGWRVQGHKAFPDHHPYSSADLAAIARVAHDSGAAAIVTTEKDAVRIASDVRAPGGKPLPMLVARLEVSLDDAFHEWLRERLRKARRV